MPPRDYYVDLARKGLVMPIGTDLVLQESPDPEAVLRNGEKLGRVVVEAARRWRTPLAVPLMDLRIEKQALGRALGVAGEELESYHVDSADTVRGVVGLAASVLREPTARMSATCGGIRHVAAQEGLLPIGMCIGPFSLMTKLVADPILPVYLAGAGNSAADDPDVVLVEAVLELGLSVILAYVQMQIEAGARAMVVCEPAANIHYLSPKQLAAGADTFERYVLRTNRRLKELLDWNGVDLIFHNCGELTDDMVRSFGELDPAIISLGSSRVLWDDHNLLPPDVVMYGNLPSKRFYSDEAISSEEVLRSSEELRERMRRIGRPFILGTECDVLSVPGCGQTILHKVDVMMGCAVTAGCRCAG